MMNILYVLINNDTNLFARFIHVDLPRQQKKCNARAEVVAGAILTYCSRNATGC